MDRTKLLTAEAADTVIGNDICFFLAILVPLDTYGMHRTGALAFAASDARFGTDHGTGRKPTVNSATCNLW